MVVMTVVIVMIIGQMIFIILRTMVIFLLCFEKCFLCFAFFVTEPAPCDQGLDLGILIDRSLSIRQRNLEQLLKSFMPSFFKGFKISKTETNIGIVMYDKAAKLVAPFNGPKSRSNKKATAFVKGLHPGVYLQTRTDKGLIAAYNHLFRKKAGDRRKKQNVLVTFSDGRAWPRRRIKPFSETVPPLRVG